VNDDDASAVSRGRFQVWSGVQGFEAMGIKTRSELSRVIGGR
jgi:hypothetical protein